LNHRRAATMCQILNTLLKGTPYTLLKGTPSQEGIKRQHGGFSLALFTICSYVEFESIETKASSLWIPGTWGYHGVQLRLLCWPEPRVADNQIAAVAL
jgi:hypothetical protein